VTDPRQSHYVTVDREVLQELGELMNLVTQSPSARRAVALTLQLVETDPAGIPRITRRLHALDDEP
jgi:hypothetical protein